jgi:hypothetical protein
VGAAVDAYVQVSLVGFAAGGAFLSLAYFDLPYYLVAYVVLVHAIVCRRSVAGIGNPAIAVAGGSPESSKARTPHEFVGRVSPIAVRGA